MGVATHASRLELPVLANDQDTHALAREADRRLDPLDASRVWAYLIRDHGIYAWGADLAGARRHLEAVEHLLEIELALDAGRGGTSG